MPDQMLEIGSIQIGGIDKRIAVGPGASGQPPCLKPLANAVFGQVGHSGKGRHIVTLAAGTGSGGFGLGGGRG